MKARTNELSRQQKGMAKGQFSHVFHSLPGIGDGTKTGVDRIGRKELHAKADPIGKKERAVG